MVKVDATRFTPPERPMCGRCYDEVDEVFPANCTEKPEALRGQPKGNQHSLGKTQSKESNLKRSLALKGNTNAKRKI